MNLRTLMETPATRAGAFFALTFAIGIVVGTALGTPEAGARTGIVLGLVFAALAALFLRPGGGEGNDGDTEDGTE